MNIQSKYAHLFQIEKNDGASELEVAILHGKFIHEIEHYMNLRGLNKKELAAKVDTSPSYITQLFRGDKMLNMQMLSKLQSALNINLSLQVKDLDNQKKETKIRQLWEFRGQPMECFKNAELGSIAG